MTTAKGRKKACPKRVQPAREQYILDASQFELGKVIGSGSFATVHLGTHVPSGKVWAVKRLDNARAAQEAQVQPHPSARSIRDTQMLSSILLVPERISILHVLDL